MPLAAKRSKSGKEWKPFLHQEAVLPFFLQWEAILSSFLQWEVIQIFLWDCEAVWKQTRYIPWWLSNLETSGIRLQRDGQVVALTASAFLHRGGSEWMEPVTSSVSIFVSLSCETVTRVWRGDRRIKAREVRGGGASLMLPRGIMTTPFRWDWETLEEEAVKVTRIGFPSPHSLLSLLSNFAEWSKENFSVWWTFPEVDLDGFSVIDGLFFLTCENLWFLDPVYEIWSLMPVANCFFNNLMRIPEISDHHDKKGQSDGRVHATVSCSRTVRVNLRIAEPLFAYKWSLCYDSVTALKSLSPSSRCVFSVFCFHCGILADSPAISP